MQPFDARDCSYFPVTAERLGFPGGRSVRKERRGRWPETMCHTHPPTHTHRHRHRHRHTHTDTDTQPHTDQEGGGQKVGTTVDGQNYASLTKNTCRRLCVTRWPPRPPISMLRSARAGPGVSRERTKWLRHLTRQTWVPPTLKSGGRGGASLSTTTTRLPSPPPMSSTGWCKVLSIYRLRCSLGQCFPARRAQELLLGPIQRPCLEAVATPRVASRRPSQVFVRCHFGPSALSSPRISSTCLCAALLPPRPSNPRTAQVPPDRDGGRFEDEPPVHDALGEGHGAPHVP